MTSKDKDKVCDNNQEMIQDIISRRGDREKISTNNPNQIKNSNSIKRQLTATSQYGDEETLIDEDNNPFITVNQNKRKQQRKNECEIIEINNDNVQGTIDITSSSTFTKTGGRLFINSSKRTSKNNHMLYDTQSPGMNHRQHSKERMRNDRTFARTTEPDINLESPMFVKAKRNENGIINETNVNSPCNEPHISQHALNYAAETHLPPIHIKCNPKIEEHQKGKELIKALFLYIEKDFRKINNHYNLPLGFEYWFIDKNGDLTCYTKHTELFVYLCEPQNYPPNLLTTDINPSKPKHLPAHHTLVLKYVPIEITIDEIHDELKLIVNSIFLIEDMIGSKTDKFRHIRLEVKSPNDYEKLIQKGGITIEGRLIEIREFLAPPRLLICSKCNDPGHIRKNCTLNYESCRRCGHDRSISDHKECTIKCHRCNGDHLSTDFKCPYLIEYRRSLISQLKRKPYLLPPNVQIFVPSECRERGNMKMKSIHNPISNNSFCQPYKGSHLNAQQQNSFNINKHQWPSLGNNHSTNHVHQSSSIKSVWDELKNKQIEINELKQEFDMKIKQSQSEFNSNFKKFKEILSIISTQNRYQNDNIARCYQTLNEYSSLLTATFDAFQQFIKKSTSSNKNNQNDGESQEILSQISNSIKCINERNQLLMANQQSLNQLIDQQGQLLIQAVDSLAPHNE